VFFGTGSEGVELLAKDDVRTGDPVTVRELVTLRADW
jgi:hypothetical protein